MCLSWCLCHLESCKECVSVHVYLFLVVCVCVTCSCVCLFAERFVKQRVNFSKELYYPRLGRDHCFPTSSCEETMVGCLTPFDLYSMILNKPEQHQIHLPFVYWSRANPSCPSPTTSLQIPTSFYVDIK